MIAKRLYFYHEPLPSEHLEKLRGLPQTRHGNDRLIAPLGNTLRPRYLPARCQMQSARRLLTEGAIRIAAVALKYHVDIREAAGGLSQRSRRQQSTVTQASLRIEHE